MFTLPDTDPYTDSDNVQKGYTMTETYGDSDARSQWKLVKSHLLRANIGAKLDTVAIGIWIRIRIGISGGPEEILYIIIKLNSLWIGIGIGVGQCKHTINLICVFKKSMKFWHPKFWLI